MPTITIIRGLPGSGKSTYANHLVHSVFAFHIEADMYFVRADGVYRFVPEELAAAHEWCREKVREVMEEGIDDVIVSNTFTRHWELEPYVAMAQTYKYRCFVIAMCGGTYPNVHNVPEETINKMRERWEP